ncbi:hypothetical protein QQF64_006631 [Cirrhinus molitorella]|uniref:Uncharacterized protein n=1 Tax=Cirrhinus molitorella TaxID=172907 RepID=A0ABR3M8F4_9TELE
MVPKPDGTLRFCNDFRRLNEVSEFDGYPMPRVDELLDRLGGPGTSPPWISPKATGKSLNQRRQGQDRVLNSFRHWQYRTLPFGLHGLPPRSSA